MAAAILEGSYINAIFNETGSSNTPRIRAVSSLAAAAAWIRIDDQVRICFRWDVDGIHDVEVVITIS
jgi:hypothetical protein